MVDYNFLRTKNKKYIDKLNLPNLTGKGVKVLIFDKYTPYTLDILPDMKLFPTCNKYGIHGTWCGEIFKILAPDVELYGCGFSCPLDEVIDYAINNNIKLISASITFTHSDSNNKALKRYYDLGGVFVSAAGNDNDKKVKYPANSPYTIGVSATNSEDCDGEEIDVTADSYWMVYNKDGRPTVFNGTSCSTPVIASCIALILEKYPNWNCEDMRKFLKENSVTNLTSLEKHERFFSFPEKWGDDMKVVFKENDTIFYVDGVKKQSRIAPHIKNGVMMMPMRELCEAIGAKVEWNEVTKEVIIIK